MKVLIWTRSRADWQNDAAKIKSIITNPQVYVVHLPCIQLEPISYDDLNEGSFDVAIITSANVLRFASAGLKTALKNCARIYTHGTKTAALAKSQGLSQIQTMAARTATELLKLVLPSLGYGTRVFLPGAEQPASDLAQPIKDAGCEVVTLPVYRTLSAARSDDGTILTAEAIRLAQANWSGGVCFASPSAVQAFAKTYVPETNRLRDSLIAVAIGPSTATACQGLFSRIEQARSNSIEDLLLQAKKITSCETIA